MRILIAGDSEADWLAKCHEAFRTGLRRSFDVRMFGRGYPGFEEGFKSYRQILSHCFPDYPPDLALVDFDITPNTKNRFTYDDLRDLCARKAILVGDYWNITQNYAVEFVDLVVREQIDLILTYFPQPIYYFRESPIASRFVYLPPSFDPEIFNDWQQPKDHDVGFLAAGTTEFTNFYPERYTIHQALLKTDNLRYLWAQHRSGAVYLNRNSLVSGIALIPICGKRVFPTRQRLGGNEGSRSY